MKLMLVLKYLETKFDKQPLKVKLELILFPLLIFAVLVIFINYTNKTNSFDKTDNETMEFNNIIMKKKILTILNDLEYFIKKNNIQLIKISNTRQLINIEIKSSLVNQIKFIKLVEDYNSFSKIKYLKKEGEILALEIVFGKLYLKNSFDLKNRLINIQNSKTKTETKNVNLNLFAIVDNKVLINDKWLRKKDFISSYRILDIKINSVILNNSLRTIELKINKNENN